MGEKLIERLKNCPNCGGILGEDGRCKYCGSKVYDFLTLDFDSWGSMSSHEKTYIRVRSNGKIMLMPIIYVQNCSITLQPQYTTYRDDSGMLFSFPRTTYTDMELHFCCGDLVSGEEG